MGGFGRVRNTLVGVGTVGLLVGAVAWSLPRHTVTAAQQPSQAREFKISAHKYAYSTQRIEVEQNDLVKITLETTDIPHSFTLDAYRIAKRAAPGQPVVFEFQADQVGTFTFYCNLTSDDGCRAMRGELIVHPKK